MESKVRKFCITRGFTLGVKVTCTKLEVCQITKYVRLRNIAIRVPGNKEHGNRLNIKVDGWEYSILF